MGERGVHSIDMCRLLFCLYVCASVCAFWYTLQIHLKIETKFEYQEHEFKIKVIGAIKLEISVKKLG